MSLRYKLFPLLIRACLEQAKERRSERCDMGKMRTVEMKDAPPRLAQLVQDVSEGGQPYFIVVNSKVKAVLVGIQQYSDMIEQIEDWNTPTGTSLVP